MKSNSNRQELYDFLGLMSFTGMIVFLMWVVL